MIKKIKAKLQLQQIITLLKGVEEEKLLKQLMKDWKTKKKEINIKESLN